MDLIPRFTIPFELFRLNSAFLFILGFFTFLFPGIMASPRNKLTKKGNLYARYWASLNISVGIMSFLYSNVTEADMGRNIFAFGMLLYHSYMMINSFPFPWNTTGFFDFFRMFFFFLFYGFLSVHHLQYLKDYPEVYKMAQNSLVSLLHEIQAMF